MIRSNRKLSAIEVPLDAIEEGWESLFQELSDSQNSQLSESRNVVILASSKTDAQRLDEYVSLLAELHTGRFFVVCAADDSKQLHAQVSLTHQTEDESSPFYCPVVYLQCPAHRHEALASLIRRYRIPGVQLDLVVIDSGVSWELVQKLGSESKELFFSSSDFVESHGGLQAILDSSVRRVDTNWIASRAWRQAIKSLFAQRKVLDHVPHLERLEVCYTLPEGQSSSLLAILVVGWIIERLDLTVQSVGLAGIECSDRTGTPMHVELLAVPGAQAGLESITFKFRDKTTVGGAKNPNLFVSLKKGEEIQAEVHLGETYRFSFAIVDESHFSCLKRYFSVGESVVRYDGALKRALEVYNLQRGFIATETR